MVKKFEFNIMDAAGYGYYRLWMERTYLIKLLLIPALIKLACMVTVLVLGYEDNLLRQGLVLLPGDLVQGWVLAQYLRTLLMNERWPVILPADMNEKILDALLLRARGIVACALSYALIALVTYFLRFCIFGQLPADDMAANIANAEDGQVPDVSFLMIVPMIATLLGFVWAFRLMWIYIPFSVLMPAKDYLKALGGFSSSLKMIALFFCSMVPVMFVSVMVSRGIFNILGGGADDSATNFPQFIVVVVAVFSEMLATLATTGAFAWAMRDILPKHPDALKELPKLGE